MLIVGTDAGGVETDLVAGRLACPVCGAGLRPRGHSADREIRQLNAVERRRFRRSIWATCAVTHVLMPEDTLVRRRDSAAVVGAALVAKTNGEGHRTIAETLSRPASTVRGWSLVSVVTGGGLLANAGRLCVSWPERTTPGRAAGVRRSPAAFSTAGSAPIGPAGLRRLLRLPAPACR